VRDDTRRDYQVKAIFVALVTFGIGFVFLAVGIVIIGLTTGAIP